MTTTLTSLLTDVRDRLNDNSATPQWSNTMLTRWINEGLRDVARRTETLMDRSTITAVAGTQEYTMPTTVHRVHRVEYKRTGDSQIYPLEYRDFNNLDAVWWTSQSITQGTPSFFTMWGFPPSLKLVVYPTPSTAGTFKVFYFREPATLVNGTDVAEIPEGWWDLIALYCEFVALRRDADPRWQEAKQLYEDSIAHMMELTQSWSNQAGMIVQETSMVPAWLYGGDY